MSIEIGFNISILLLILGAVFSWFLYDWLYQMKITIHYLENNESQSKTVNFFELIHLLISRKATISRKLKITVKSF